MHKRIVLIAVFGVWFLLALTSCGSGGGSGGSIPVQTVPILTSVSPPSALMGSATFNLTAIGSNFVSGSQIMWNGTALSTTYESPTQLVAQVPASNLGTLGTVQVSVVNPGASGGSSNFQAFSITNQVPGLYSISPTSAMAGGGTFTLTANGAFNSTSQVQWDGVSQTTSFVSKTQLTAQIPAANLISASSVQVSVFNPGTGGGQSTSQIFYINSGATRLSTVSLNVNSMIWDPATSRIYATVPGSSGPNSNSVVAIDPVSGGIGTPQPAGINPDLLALSFDNSYLWVGEDGSGVIQRFAMPNLAPDITITLPPPRVSSAQSYVMTMAAAPDNAHTLAASMYLGSLQIYDDKVPRSSGQTENYFGSYPPNSIQWGSDSSVLYGVLPSDSVVLSVNNAGFSVQNDYGYVFKPFVGQVHYDPSTSYLYADDGEVEDTATGDLIGTFNAINAFSYFEGQYWRCVPDAANGLVYCAGYLSHPTTEFGIAIEVFDKKTYRLLRTLPLPQIEGVLGTFIRWGNAGLALSTGPYPYPTADGFSGAIYLIDGSFVNPAAAADSTSGTGVQPVPVLNSISPQSATAGSGDVTLTVTGANFEKGTVVLYGSAGANVNGTPLNTTFVNEGELRATLPSAQLAKAQSWSIFVSNGDPTTQAANIDSFTVLPVGANMSVVNLVARDVAWDKNSGLLYVAVSDEDDQYSNSIVAVDPASGQVVKKSPFAGTDPYLARPSADGTYLYAASRTGGVVTQFQLPGLTLLNTWTLGRDTATISGPYYAIDVQPSPGNSQTTAIALEQYNIIPASGGIKIFDNNIARPQQTFGSVYGTMDYYDSVQWSSDGSMLYVANNEVTSYDYYTLGVNASGVNLINDYPNTFPRSNGYGRLTNSRIHFDTGTGYIYNDDGEIIDPVNGAQVGYIGATGLVAPDSSLNRVFILGQTTDQAASNSYTIQSFDQKTLALVGSLTISGMIGSPMKLIRWGSTGLALAAYSSSNDVSNQPYGMLYILNNPIFVSANQASTQMGVEPELVQRRWIPATAPNDAARRLRH